MAPLLHANWRLARDANIFVPPRFTREELELLPDEIEGIKSGDDDELR